MEPLSLSRLCGRAAPPLVVRPVVTYSKGWVRSQSRMSATSNQQTYQVAGVTGRLVLDALKRAWRSAAARGVEWPLPVSDGARGARGRRPHHLGPAPAIVSNHSLSYFTLAECVSVFLGRSKEVRGQPWGGRPVASAGRARPRRLLPRQEWTHAVTQEAMEATRAPPTDSARAATDRLLLHVLDACVWARRVSPASTSSKRRQSWPASTGMTFDSVRSACSSPHRGLQAAVTGAPHMFSLPSSLGGALRKVVYRAQMPRTWALLLRFAGREGYLLGGPAVPAQLQDGPFLLHPVDERTAGAYRDPVVCCDFSSLYPSVFQAHNMVRASLPPPLPLQPPYARGPTPPLP